MELMASASGLDGFPDAARRPCPQHDTFYWLDPVGTVRLQMAAAGATALQVSRCWIQQNASVMDLRELQRALEPFAGKKRVLHPWSHLLHVIKRCLAFLGSICLPYSPSDDLHIATAASHH